MKKVHIFYTGFVSDDGTTMSLGGVQTYLINLTKVLNEIGFEVHFYKPSSMEFDTVHYNIKMHGFKSGVIRKNSVKQTKAAFHHYKSCIDPKEDIVLFPGDIEACKTRGIKSIALQHGIFWDIPIDIQTMPLFSYLKALCRKYYGILQRLHCINKVDQWVCVDYNFMNWYRAMVPICKTKMTVIPNFSPLPSPFEKPNDGSINIVFARRFEPFRGTRVFCSAISRILSQYSNVHVTLAGWGSDEQFLHDNLKSFGDKVEFTKFVSEESLYFHKDKHIAVVPTVGSEGTSLSLLEAMASNCAVIGSDVGGITNIIIDGYNGLLIPAGDSEQLYLKLKYLLDNPSEINRLAKMGYDCVRASFSYEIWKERWVCLMKDFMKKSK